MTRHKFQTALVCPNCRQAGSAHWEENENANPLGPQRKLISLEGAFHSEIGRTHSGDPMIVCGTCDEIQQD